MKELLEFSFSGVNIIPSFLMILTSLYWLVAIFGLIDVEALDIDLDLDVDADMDADVGGTTAVLAYFNLGDMPLMIFLSFFTLPLWLGTIGLTDLFGIESFWLGLAILIPVMIGSLFVAKILTYPIAKFYKKAKENNEAVVVLGQTCIAKLPISNDRTGQAEIKSRGTSVLINVRTTSEDMVIPKGEKAIVISEDLENNIYYVEPY